MKRITIAKVKEDIVVNSFDEMLKSFRYIGFIPEDNEIRCMVVTSGPYKGVAINHENSWTNLEYQPNADGEYYMFDSAAELYKWMGESDEFN